MALVVARLPARLPLTLSEARVEAKKDAISLLRSVASGQFYVAPAVTLAAEQPGGGVEQVDGDGHYPTSTQLNGLI